MDRLRGATPRKPAGGQRPVLSMGEGEERTRAESVLLLLLCMMLLKKGKTESVVVDGGMGGNWKGRVTQREREEQRERRERTQREKKESRD